MIYKHTAVMSNNKMRSTSKCNRKSIHKIKACIRYVCKTQSPKNREGITVIKKSVLFCTQI